MSGDSSTYRYGPRETAGVMAGLRYPQLIAIGLAVGVFVAGMQWGLLGTAVALVPALALLGVAFVPFAGRQLDEWVPVVAGYCWRRWRGQTEFRGGPVAVDRDRFAPDLALPGSLHPLRLLSMPAAGSEIAVVKDVSRRTYTAVLECRGRSFLLLESGTQRRRVRGWGSLLASLCRERSIVARVAWLERAVPDSGDALARHWAEQGVASSPAAASYQKLIQHAGPVAQQHSTLLTVTMHAPVGWTARMHPAARAVRQAGGGDAGALGVLARELRSIEDGLARAEVSTVGWLPPRRLAQIVRDAYDPASTHMIAKRGGSIPQLPAGVDPAVAGPMACATSWDHYKTDSAVHATYWVSEWPRVEVAAGFLAPILLSDGVRRTLTVIAEPIAPSTAQREVRRARVDRATDDRLRAKWKMIKTRRAEREDAEVLARETELVSGHGDYRFWGLLTVSGRDEKALDAATSAMENAAAKAGLEIRRLVGEQDTYFGVAALPLGRGVQ